MSADILRSAPAVAGLTSESSRLRPGEVARRSILSPLRPSSLGRWLSGARGRTSYVYAMAVAQPPRDRWRSRLRVAATTRTQPLCSPAVSSRPQAVVLLRTLACLLEHATAGDREARSCVVPDSGLGWMCRVYSASSAGSSDAVRSSSRRPNLAERLAAPERRPSGEHILCARAARRDLRVRYAGVRAADGCANPFFRQQAPLPPRGVLAWSPAWS
jgi:hypothetical protein